PIISSLFSFQDTAPTQIYTLSLHDALPIWCRSMLPPKRRLSWCILRPAWWSARSRRERPRPMDTVGRKRLSPAAYFGVVILADRSEEHTSELQSRFDLVCRLLLEKKN